MYIIKIPNKIIFTRGNINSLLWMWKIYQIQSVNSNRKCQVIHNSRLMIRSTFYYPAPCHKFEVSRTKYQIWETLWSVVLMMGRVDTLSVEVVAPKTVPWTPTPKRRPWGPSRSVYLTMSYGVICRMLTSRLRKLAFWP